MNMTLSRRNALFLTAVAAILPIAVAAPSPAGQDLPLAIKGYDPVAYFTDGKPMGGSAEFEYEWDDHRWRFASAEHRDLFKAAPARYAPQFGLGHGTLGADRRVTGTVKTPPAIERQSGRLVPFSLDRPSPPGVGRGFRVRSE